MKRSRAKASQTSTLLIIGTSGVGKTMLMRQLKRKLVCRGGADASGPKGDDDEAVIRTDTIATVGFETTTVTMPRGGRGAGGRRSEAGAVTLREVGSPMMLMWSKYYAAATTIVYVVDGADASRVAPSWVELLRLLGELRQAPAAAPAVAVLVNKTDLCSGADAAAAVRATMRLDELAPACAPRPLAIFEGSSVTGSGVDELLDWALAPQLAAAMTDDAPAEQGDDLAEEEYWNDSSVF